MFLAILCAFATDSLWRLDRASSLLEILPYGYMRRFSCLGGLTTWPREDGRNTIVFRWLVLYFYLCNYYCVAPWVVSTHDTCVEKLTSSPLSDSLPSNNVCRLWPVLHVFNNKKLCYCRGTMRAHCQLKSCKMLHTCLTDYILKGQQPANDLQGH